MKTLKILSFALLFSGFLISCGGEQKPEEKPNIEETMDNAGTAAEDAAKKVGEAAEDAANTVEAAVDSASSVVEGAMEGEGDETTTEDGHDGHDH